MAVRNQEHPSPQPPHPPQAIRISWASPLVFFFPTHGPIRSNGGEARKQAKRKNTLKASLGVKGAEQRMNSVMEMRVDRRSNTGGSLLRILLNRNASPTHWLQYPVSHEHTQLDPHTHIHTRLANSHAPRHVHTMHAMQMCCLPCTHTTVFLYMQLEEEDLDVRDRVGKLHV